MIDRRRWILEPLEHGDTEESARRELATRPEQPVEMKAFTLRIPKSLHALLVDRADAAGITLNEAATLALWRELDR